MKSTHKKGNVHGQRKKLVSPNARDTNMLVFSALGNAKVLSFALGDARIPNANGFALQWNKGFNCLRISVGWTVPRVSSACPCSSRWPRVVVP